MYYALFRYKKGRKEKDYRGFRTEEEMTTFLAKYWDEIAIEKLIESLAELKFGLISVLDSIEMKELDEKEAVEKKEKENPGEPEEEEEEIKDVLDKADKAIEVGEKDLKDRKLSWPLCKKCGINTCAPWSKKKICSPCQRGEKIKDKK